MPDTYLAPDGSRVEAMRLTDDTADALHRWAHPHANSVGIPEWWRYVQGVGALDPHITIVDLEQEPAVMEVATGDWVVLNEAGRLQVVPADRFATEYTPEP